MARPLSLRQRQELAGFVNALFAATDYPSTAEWARDSDYPATNLSELRNAKVGVDGYNLLKLIRAAATRSEMPAEDLALATADESPESIRQHLAKLTELVTRALELLEPPDPQVEIPARGGARTGRGKRT